MLIYCVDCLAVKCNSFIYLKIILHLCAEQILKWKCGETSHQNLESNQTLQALNNRLTYSSHVTKDEIVAPSCGGSRHVLKPLLGRSLLQWSVSIEESLTRLDWRAILSFTLI